MAKWYGIIGFISQEPREDDPGVYDEVKTERPYYGDVLRNAKRFDTAGDKVNVDLNISNRISILADQFAMNHFHQMRYLQWNDIFWNINEVEANPPRLVVSLGGVYNGGTASEGIAENS